MKDITDYLEEVDKDSQILLKKLAIISVVLGVKSVTIIALMCWYFFSGLIPLLVIMQILTLLFFATLIYSTKFTNQLSKNIGIMKGVSDIFNLIKKQNETTTL